MKDSAEAAAVVAVALVALGFATGFAAAAFLPAAAAARGAVMEDEAVVSAGVLVMVVSVVVAVKVARLRTLSAAWTRCEAAVPKKKNIRFHEKSH